MIAVEDLIYCIGIAALAALARLRGRVAAPLGADEGYLWYGVQRVLAGEWPHRDFKSYEPGRYLWCALVFLLARRRSLAALRIATHAFFALGLALMLAALDAQGVGRVELAFVAGATALWAQPQHKLFEPGIALIACAAATRLLAAPDPFSAALAGAAIGLALLFGFNLFLYCAAAAALWMAWLLVQGATEPVLLLHAAAGFLFAATPLLGAILFSPGFRRSFLERRLLSILRRGSSNLALPLPLPWRPPAAIPHAVRGARHIVIGAILLGAPVVCSALVIGGFVSRDVFDYGAAVFAAASLGVFFAHHAFGRADPPHLAQASSPFILVLTLALTQLPMSWIWLGLVCAFSAWFWLPLQPEHAARTSPQHFAPLARPDGAVLLPRPYTLLTAHLRRMRAEFPDAVLAVPTLPWLYAVLDLRAPIYDTFCVWPAAPGDEARMLTEMERGQVALAVIDDSPLDAREDLRFSATHPRVWAIVSRDFERLTTPDLPPHLHLFRRAVTRGTPTDC